MKASKGFSGFPTGQSSFTPVPGPFFSELLPAIDHLGELKLTLYVLWLLNRKPEAVPYLQRQELLGDDLLRQALVEGQAATRPAPAEGQAAFEPTLSDALERAVARGTLLRASAGEDQEYFFLNSPRGRAAAQALQEGHWRPSSDPDQPLELRLERPNIFNLYEQNIGPLTPMIAERLREAEKSYPEAWVQEAIAIAVENNVRKWRYVEAILEDWQTRGKDEREDRGDTEKARRRYRQGKFRDFWDE
jgi:DnaD/phage-associated family protein